MPASTTATRSLDDLPDFAFMREKQVLAEVVPVSDATLWRWVTEKKFPAPVKLSPGVTAWRVSDLRAWSQGI